jgi:phage tail protein X
MSDGSAADPASIGVSVLLANWTGKDSGQVDYAGAAADQLNFLLYKAPQTSDGAISHRVEQVQLWFVLDFLCWILYSHISCEGVILFTWYRPSWLTMAS